jgi:uncharacterized protein (TIGR02246 family)
MNVSTTRTFLSALVCAALIHATSSVAADATTGATSVFADLLQQRLDTVRKGDVAGYRALLADDFVRITDSGSRQVGVGNVERVVADHAGADLAYTDIQTNVFGDTALVESVLTQRISLASRELDTHYVVTDVYVRRNGRWLLRHHQETTRFEPAPMAPPPTPEALNEYAGRYEWWPGYVERYSVKAGKLFVQQDGAPDTEGLNLDAATPDAFYDPGTPGLVTFVRGPDGKVSHFVSAMPDGTVITGKRLP